LYYDNHGYYPSSLVGYCSGDVQVSDRIPKCWAAMIGDLVDDNLIQATFSLLPPALETGHFSLIKIAQAIMPVIYHRCSIQDPLYKTGNDFMSSYVYLSNSAASPRSYKIRTLLEDLNNPVLKSSLTGAFLDISTMGDRACDKTLGYYCTGRSNN